MATTTVLDTFGSDLQDSFIAKQMGRVNRNMAAVSLVLVIGVAIYFVGNWRYFSNCFSKPLPIAAEQLASIRNPEELDNYFVAVKGDRSFRSGLQSIEQQVNETTNAVESETIKADYVILRMNDRLLVVKAPPNSTSTQFQGALVELPFSVRSQITSPLVDRPDIVAAFLPVMLDATGFRNDGYVALVVCMPIVAFALWNFNKVYKRHQNPMLHPIAQMVSRFGTLRDVVAEIDADLRGPTDKIGDARIATSWIVKRQTFGITLGRLPDIVWAYKKVTRHSYNFIPTGKSYAAIAFNRNGLPIEVQGRQKAVDRLLEIIASRAPWAIFGYTDNLNKAIRADWSAFVAEVDARRGKAVSARS